MNLKMVPIRECKYEGTVEIPKEYYEHTDVLEIKNVTLKFSIHKDQNQDDILSLQAHGIFVLSDARTLEPVEDPFTIEMNEKISFESEICGRFLENSQNTLDILDILWENIVLEIPISYTVSEELEETKTKEEEMIDPRLAPLMELLKEKE